LWQDCLQDCMWKEKKEEVRNNKFFFIKHFPGMNTYEKLGFLRTIMNWYISDQREYSNYFRVHRMIQFVMVCFPHIAIWSLYQTRCTLSHSNSICRIEMSATAERHSIVNTSSWLTALGHLNPVLLSICIFSCVEAIHLYQAP
jgi:hypothetical protein